MCNVEEAPFGSVSSQVIAVSDYVICAPPQAAATVASLLWWDCEPK